MKCGEYVDREGHVKLEEGEPECGGEVGGIVLYHAEGNEDDLYVCDDHFYALTGHTSPQCGESHNGLGGVSWQSACKGKVIGVVAPAILTEMFPSFGLRVCAECWDKMKVAMPPTFVGEPEDFFHPLQAEG